MTARQQPGFDPDQLTPGDNCTVRFGSGRPTRAEFVRRTRNPDWFIVRHWNPYERRWATKLVRLHRRAFVSRTGPINTDPKQEKPMATPLEQLAFERALGRAAIGALVTALNDLNHFDKEASWPEDQFFIGRTSADIETIAAELAQRVRQRLDDVIAGPGLAIVTRGELVDQPAIATMILDARDRQHDHSG